MNRHLLLILALLSTPILARAEPASPDGFISDAMIREACQRIQDGDTITTLAWKDLQERAKAALDHRADPPKHFDVPGFYGPNRDEHRRMKNMLGKDAEAAYLSALCWRIMTGLDPDSQEAAPYARQAAGLIDAWATGNKKVAGHDGALGMCYNGTALVVSAQLIRDAPAWTDDHHERFSAWLNQVFGPQTRIKGRKNNWAGWGIFASLVANAYRLDAAALRADTERLKQIIDAQIEPDGSMPHEIGRGKNGFWYTYFALAPMAAAVETVRNTGGPDLYTYTPPSKGTLREGIRFFYERGLADPSKWPNDKATIEPEPSEKHGVLMFSMGLVFNEQDWKTLPSTRSIEQRPA